jgi:hypothetical protein
MRSAGFVVAVLAVVVVARGSASGHHSHPAFYDACTTLTIEGQIDSVQWKNSHARFPSLTLDAPVKPVVDVASIRGASGKWSWKRSEPETAPDCGRK